MSVHDLPSEFWLVFDDNMLDCRAYPVEQMSGYLPHTNQVKVRVVRDDDSDPLYKVIDILAGKLLHASPSPGPRFVTEAGEGREVKS